MAWLFPISVRATRCPGGHYGDLGGGGPVLWLQWAACEWPCLPPSQPAGALWGHVQALTWVPGHVSGHLVVAVELLPPQELVPGHGLPLAAHQTGGQYVRGAQAQEDLVDEAVREQGSAPLIHCDILPRKP